MAVISDQSMVSAELRAHAARGEGLEFEKVWDRVDGDQMHLGRTWVP